MDRNQIKNIKQSANEFFQAAQKYVQDQEGALAGILKMTIKGPPLGMDNNVQEKEERLVRQCVRALGVEFGSEEEIEELIWGHFWRSFSDTRTEIGEQLLRAELGSDEERVKLWDHFERSFLDTNRILNISEITERFLDDISRYEQRSYGYLAPNFVIKFSDQAQKIVIGPVEAIQTEYFLENQAKIPKNITIWRGKIVIPILSEIRVGSKYNWSISNGNIFLEFPQACWYIPMGSIKAARRNAEEKAIWLINIAISLLRLCYPKPEREKYPEIGDIEEMPLIEPKKFWFGDRTEEKGIVLDRIDREDETTNQPSMGLSLPVNSSIRRIPCTYLVDETVVALTEEQKFKDRAHVIFNPSKNSLAERFSQGLGWLTRGRQTVDRAERFLFFFTAIEALLSSDDKSAPVVQTISRHAATILHTDPQDRKDFAGQLGSLYGVRSALVHAGKRDVSQKQTMEAQRIAEELYKTVMENYPLDSKFNKFQESLSKASYGSLWPFK